MRAKIGAVFPMKENKELVVECDFSSEALDLITSFDEAEGPEALKIALAEINIQTQDWERPTKRPNN